MSRKDLKKLLDGRVAAYNQPGFIPDDPVSIPHRFTLRQDIEIAGFFAAVFSWGNRAVIVRKAGELMDLMDNAPYQFITGHEPRDRVRLLGFRHRTFNPTDLLYFIEFFAAYYRECGSLEEAFAEGYDPNGREPMEGALNGFRRRFFRREDVPARTRKHIAAPERNASCKRINMFLRWMVRTDGQGVDFGLWRRLSPAHLVCPLDIHVTRVARRLGLLERQATDWKAAVELTGALRELDPLDPVRYDFALFGMGVTENFR